MTQLEKKNIITTTIYESLDYMYCDNCRFNSEIKESDCTEYNGISWGCEDCHRKYNGWGISKREAQRITKQIFELLDLK